MDQISILPTIDEYLISEGKGSAPEPGASHPREGTDMPRQPSLPASGATAGESGTRPIRELTFSFRLDLCYRHSREIRCGREAELDQETLHHAPAQAPVAVSRTRWKDGKGRRKWRGEREQTGRAGIVRSTR
jgi:hypothetical protein